MKKPVVEFADFGFQYKAQKNPTLTGINLTIYEGEKVLLLGSSGSGKTTLANCINGLIPFSYPGQITGSCKVNGRETQELSVFALSMDVGTVLQDSNAQFVGLSVGEDMAFALENDGVDRETMRERVRDQAETVGLAHYLDALPFHLSGGQKQKAALGGVLGEETRIFIFDEPLASLDPKTGAAAIDLIDRITRNAGGSPRTSIIIEHRLEDVLFRPVDRIVLVDKGRIAADMRPADILQSGILPEKGIRLPLYIGALQYAGCDLAGIQAIEDIHALEPGAENRKRLKRFFGGADEMSGIDGAAQDNQPDPKRELLRVEGVGFSYETAEGGSRAALEDASFTVRRGERVAFIGKNGAGKSTMAKLITGICRPDKGAVYLGGEDYRKLTVSEIGERVGYVMQDPDQMIVKDIIKDEVELGLRLRPPGPLGAFLGRNASSRRVGAPSGGKGALSGLLRRFAPRNDGPPGAFLERNGSSRRAGAPSGGKGVFSGLLRRFATRNDRAASPCNDEAASPRSDGPPGAFLGRDVSSRRVGAPSGGKGVFSGLLRRFAPRNDGLARPHNDGVASPRNDGVACHCGRSEAIQKRDILSPEGGCQDPFMVQCAQGPTAGVPQGLPSDLITERGKRALEACELYRMRNWPISAVSYGQKKRVTVASVLAMEPEILILDEPTAGQDYRHYMEIIAFINRLNAEYGKTVIFITHDLHLAIENTDRAVVFAEGKIIADGDIFSILTDERIVEEANLKKTSLHLLAGKAGLAADDFIRRYIRHEKAHRAGTETTMTEGGTR
ncbi:MAG: DUF3744 domain-containing protein [Spirochaetaceae bacterium]|nr:DUF3744 domain-containing protein [Spirochaetaceae bacterium]